MLWASSAGLRTGPCIPKPSTAQPGVNFLKCCSHVPELVHHSPWPTGKGANISLTHGALHCFMPPKLPLPPLPTWPLCLGPTKRARLGRALCPLRMLCPLPRMSVPLVLVHLTNTNPSFQTKLTLPHIQPPRVFPYWSPERRQISVATYHLDDHCCPPRSKKGISDCLYQKHRQQADQTHSARCMTPTAPASI